MTVEALRRRRPETLDALLATYGRELQAVAYLILRDRPAAVEERVAEAGEQHGEVLHALVLDDEVVVVPLELAVQDARVGGRREHERDREQAREPGLGSCGGARRDGGFSRSWSGAAHGGGMILAVRVHRNRGARGS